MNKKAASKLIYGVIIGLIIAIILFFPTKAVTQTLFSILIGSEENQDEFPYYEPLELTEEQLDNLEKYKEFTSKASSSFGVPESLIQAIIAIESSGNFKAISPKCGAVGLMQLMPLTAEENDIKNIFDLESYRKNNPKGGCDEEYTAALEDTIQDKTEEELKQIDGRFDQERNIMAGTRYFKSLLDEFDGNVELTLAAYNWGKSKVKVKCRSTIESCDFGTNEETPKYVADVLGYEASLA